jgi:D-tyrosyl-tRNA(Tyr) deacylase
MPFMRSVVQRVSRARVSVEGAVVGEIDRGLLVLIGAGAGDAAADVAYTVDKIVNLRIFADEAGKMNRSVLDVGGGVLAVSQFTLYGDARKGRRPAFVDALEPAAAEQRYQDVVTGLHAAGVARVATGVFRAHMEVELVNDGPVTILLDSRKTFSACRSAPSCGGGWRRAPWPCWGSRCWCSSSSTWCPAIRSTGWPAATRRRSSAPTWPSACTWTSRS